MEKSRLIFFSFKELWFKSKFLDFETNSEKQYIIPITEAPMSVAMVWERDTALGQEDTPFLTGTKEVFPFWLFFGGAP